MENFREKLEAGKQVAFVVKKALLLMIRRFLTPMQTGLSERIL